MSISYHSKFIDFYLGFSEAEKEESAATNALTELKTLLADRILIEYVRFIADNTESLFTLLTRFEGRQPTIHSAYNRVMELYANFANKASDEARPERQRTAKADAADKLQQYYCLGRAPVARP